MVDLGLAWSDLLIKLSLVQMPVNGTARQAHLFKGNTM